MEDELRPSGNEQEEGEGGVLVEKADFAGAGSILGSFYSWFYSVGWGKCNSVGLVRRIQEECLKGW